MFGTVFDIVFNGFDPLVATGLLAASFAGSFVTVAFGIGGGVLLLAVMASLMPPAALIPVHGVVQLGSNLFRALLLRAHVHWPPVAVFVAGSVVGVAVGGVVAINLPPAVVQIGIGGFVIYSVLSSPPVWLSRQGLVIGALSSFLSMFFGATGVFVANFVKSLNLPRQTHVATHATLMTCQHLLKIVTFGVLGFAFGPWVLFILAMIGAGFLGTVIGRRVLISMSDTGFRQALNVILVLLSIRLIFTGIAQLWVGA
ncbi:sulfite exporter TauE/SafE family protein [Flavimaricola marinus]|uniref:Probable membrane transporter protein n=1 Tax=Flavimaricola marinus TaxID=1819565 RepID=A0A238LBD0_9RHOB|nr:sulfite exporter TauE/SafE family protein [Flavimaricola marinus]SMY06276.1 Sulfite exporter TauE/SafE [Flavimaricola marinus]